MAWAIPEKIQRYHCTGAMVEDMEFPGGMEERACGLWKFQGSIKKEVEFPNARVFKQNPCGISIMGLCF